MSIDFSVPREYIAWEGEGDPGPCPKCGAPLKQEYAMYMVLTRHGNEMADSFMTTSDEGWFCTQCPVLLLNPQAISEGLPFGFRKWDVGDEFAIVGIVDLDAIPPKKQDLPLGAPNNPVPLVEFCNVKGPRPAQSSESTPRRSHRRPRSKPRRR